MTSEIPVQSAEWSVKRSVAIGGRGIETSNPAQSTFNIEVPRGVHSPGLLAAAVRGTQIDSVSVLRYEIVDVAGEPTKQELYRWDLNDLFITEVGMHMRPGNSSDEVDTISFLPRFVNWKRRIRIRIRLPFPLGPSSIFRPIQVKAAAIL